MKNLAKKEIALSEKEVEAIKAFQKYSDAPDSEEDDLAWCQPEDLIRYGFTKHQAAGLFSSLLEKKVIQLYEPRSKAEGGDLFVFPWNIVPIKATLSKKDRDAGGPFPIADDLTL